MTQDDYNTETTVVRANDVDDPVMDTGWHEVSGLRVRTIISSGDASELRRRWFERYLYQDRENGVGSPVQKITRTSSSDVDS